MGRQEREQAVAQLSDRMQQAAGGIVVDYTRLNVAQISELRKQIKESGSEFKVAKNTLLRIAAKGTAFEPLQDAFSGQTAVTFIDGDPVLAAKALTKFVKDNKKNPEFAFSIRGGVLESSVLSNTDIEQLGELPSKEVLLGQLVGTLAAPMTGFLTVLTEIPRSFLRVLTAVKEQKEG